MFSLCLGSGVGPPGAWGPLLLSSGPVDGGLDTTWALDATPSMDPPLPPASFPTHPTLGAQRYLPSDYEGDGTHSQEPCSLAGGGYSWAGTVLSFAGQGE